MERAAAWSRIGTDVCTCTNIEDVLNSAGLNYDVSLVPVSAEGLVVPHRKATLATYSDGSQKVKGIVSDNYRICQNFDAFQFIDEISTNHHLEFVKAGETYNGTVYVVGKLPGIEVLGDEVVPYVIFQNSHNGQSPLRATICALRLVCQNQFASTFNHQDNAIHIRHTSSLTDNLIASKQILAETIGYMDQFKHDAEQLYATKLSINQINTIFDTYLRKSRESQQLSVRQENKLQEELRTLHSAYDADDNQNFKGTAWGAVNAFTDFLTHKPVKSTAKSEDNCFMVTAIDPRMINLLYSIVKEVTV